MNWLERSRKKCWRIFAEEYPDYVPEDERYLAKIQAFTTPRSRVLDAGCGWDAPFARKLAESAHLVVGVDVGMETPVQAPNVALVQGDLERLPFASETFDLVVSRSVFEHLERPDVVFRELSRVLRAGGHLVFLVPNLWDYVSLASALVPNRLHGAIVEAIQGRSRRDTFPTHYRANTTWRLRKLMRGAGMEPVEMALLSQYPAYLMFSPTLFRLGVAFERLVRERGRLAWLRSWILGVAVKSRGDGTA